ncbi:hypothetical protein FRC12_012167 [Ceratobasidium sp. 428]|nr:hypothetical protein FRC12_012167 [Ceratobasidium sp. 428]
MCIGNQSMLLLADPTEAERVIVQGKNVEMIKFVNIIYSRLMPTGQISLPTNDMWRRHRNVLGPSMHQQYLSRMASHVATAANDLVNLWQTKQRIAKEKAFDAKIDLKLAMMDSIGMLGG